MHKQINKVKEIDVASVAGNKTLAAAVDRRAVERCKESIETLGVVHTPVVGTTKEGARLLLSGQCELTALRELGVKRMDAIEVGAADDGGARAKLSLLLISLQDKPGALCEGLLLQEAVASGVPRLEIQAMLGKSASWVSNRLSLATRLDGNVYKMVRGGLLGPRSAQEIARLPAEAQFVFAEAAVREGLPKSAIEALVAGYNDEGCPDAVKAQMLSEPRAALARVSDKRRAVAGGRPGCHKGNARSGAADLAIKSTSMQMAALRRMFYSEPSFDAEGHKDALKELEIELYALFAIVAKLVSPGKKEVGRSVG